MPIPTPQWSSPVSISESQKVIESLKAENQRLKEQIQTLTSTLSSREKQLREALRNSQSSNERLKKAEEELARRSRSDLELQKAEKIAMIAEQMKQDAEKTKRNAQFEVQQIQAAMSLEKEKARAASLTSQQAEARARAAYADARRDIEQECVNRLNACNDREKKLSVAESNFEERRQKFDDEVKKEVEVLFQKRFIEPKKTLDKQQQDLEERERKLKEDRNSYREELDEEYNNAVSENSALKFLIKAVLCVAAVLLVGLNFYWWSKQDELKKNYALVIKYNHEYHNANEFLGAEVKKLQAQIKKDSSKKPKNK